MAYSWDLIYATFQVRFLLVELFNGSGYGSHRPQLVRIENFITLMEVSLASIILVKSRNYTGGVVLNDPLVLNGRNNLISLALVSRGSLRLKPILLPWRRLRPWFFWDLSDLWLFRVFGMLSQMAIPLKFCQSWFRPHLPHEQLFRKRQGTRVMVVTQVDFR